MFIIINNCIIGCIHKKEVNILIMKIIVMKMRMKEKRNSIYVRVKPEEKVQIARKARKCGLSVSEYIRQRCLGYAPREIPPDTYYEFCRKLDYIRELGNGDAILALLDEMRKELFLPGRDG